MTNTISFANEKGGVAKTTSTLSIAIALAESEQRVLLADLDPQANLSLSLNVWSRTGNHSIASVLLSSRTLEETITRTRFPNVDILPANQELQSVERYLPLRENYARILTGCFQQASDYDFILLDCPPSLGVLTLNALTASDLLIIPTQCEYFCAHSLQTMLDFVRTIRRELNPALRYRVLLTMFEDDDTIHSSLQSKIRQVFSSAVFQTRIDHDQLVRESQVNHQPILTYAPQSKAANQYRKLAEEISNYVSISS